MDRNKVYLDGGEVWLGDCLEIMPSIPDKSIDMILCDPPYGLNILMQGGTWGIKFKHEGSTPSLSTGVI